MASICCKLCCINTVLLDAVKKSIGNSFALCWVIGSSSSLWSASSFPGCPCKHIPYPRLEMPRIELGCSVYKASAQLQSYGHILEKQWAKQESIVHASTQRRIKGATRGCSGCWLWGLSGREKADTFQPARLFSCPVCLFRHPLLPELGSEGNVLTLHLIWLAVESHMILLMASWCFTYEQDHVGCPN